MEHKLLQLNTVDIGKENNRSTISGIEILKNSSTPS